jgi:hypothetical protein
MPALDHHDKTLPQVPEAGNSKETARTLVEMDHRCEQGEKKGGRKTSHQSHVYLWLRTRVCVGKVAWWVVF